MKFSPRVYSNKTRIKTKLFVPIESPIILREYIPTKQGLRLFGSYPSRSLLPSPRVYSNKTRIKTHLRFNHNFLFIKSPRVYSNKTRIKTSEELIFQPILYLREYIPTKQGLRPLSTEDINEMETLREYIPTKQGLRRAWI